MGRGYASTMKSVRAIRGATQALTNTPEAIESATKELLLEMISANSLLIEDFISVIFTVSPDLNAAFPASSAREVGFTDTPLICSIEIGVPGSLERAIRVMAHVESTLSKAEIIHIYQGAAKALRRDIAQ